MQKSPRQRPQKFFAAFFQKSRPCLALLTLAAAPTDPQSTLQQAVAADLGTNAAGAFALYKLAAASGLPQAQLNVAVMYDSGRGTRHDARQAATWYAAAATGGLARAAFDLGQLYDAGEGVPHNQGLAHAWFAEAAQQGLSAAAARAAATATPAGRTIEAPLTAYPPNTAHLPLATAGLAFVWTAQPTPAQASYYVEVMDLAGDTPHLAYSTTTTLSAVRMPPPTPSHYAWRVFILCPTLGRYVPSPWSTFVVE